MVMEECVTNGDGIRTFADSLEAENDGTNGVVGGSSSFSGDGNSTAVSNESLRTYKRRKHGMLNSEFKLAQFEKNASAAATKTAQALEKMIELVQNISSKYVCGPKINGPSVPNGSDDCPYHQPWRNILEYECRALNMDKDGTGGTSVPQEMADGHEGQCHTHVASMLYGSSNGERPEVINSKSTSIDRSKLTVTKRGRIAFLKLIMSEKFASLRTLFYTNFQGYDVENFFDFNDLSSKMTEGTYEENPNLFLTDVQQFWEKLHTVGAEMVSLSRSLSELSVFFFREPVGGIGHATFDDGKHQLPTWCSEWHSKLELPSSSIRASTCRCCRKESDGKDCLVCDSCEDMFHVSCIKPAVNEIPHKDWYCADCISTGAESLHENCAVCKRLDALTRTEGSGGNSVPADDETVDGLEESSGRLMENGLQVFMGGKQVNCEVCKSLLEVGDIFRCCEHYWCFRHYHLRCLTHRQLKSYGPRWYCPCCLCRVCLTDKDDSEIVLCDACDHGYHIYCLNPPLDSIPEGKWFCSKCHAGIEAINKAKRLYENLEEQTEGGKRRVNASPQKKQKQDAERFVHRSGGMDMLLSAADTLSFQEKLAALATGS